jgi:hypothetical protein
LDFSMDALGTPFDYNAGASLLTDLPDHPGALDEGNAVPMGLAVCTERISGDVPFE